MVHRKSSLSIFIVLIAACALAACAGPGAKKDDSGAEGPRIPAYFEEIPADTFFFVGGSEPLPRELVASTLSKAEGMRQLLEEFGSSIDDEIKYSYEEFEQQEQLEGEEAAGKESGSDEDAEFWLIDRMGGEISAEGLENLGVSASPHVAAYAFGPVPVVRIELSDASKFEAFVTAAEQEEGVSPVELEHRGVSYRRYDDPDGEESVLLRWNDREVVAAVVPKELDEVFLPYFVGVEKPEKSMADDNVFWRVAAAHGFERYGSGYVDMERIVSYAAGESEPEGITKKLLEQVDFEMDEPEECKQEYLRLVRMVPRLVGGIRHYDEQITDVAFGAELEESLARGLAGTVAGTPGYETQFAEQSLVEIGYGIHMGKMVDFLVERAREIQAQPFQCPQLQDWNQFASNMMMTSGQVPPAVRKLAGFNLLLRNIVLEWDSEATTPTMMVIPRALGALRTDDPEAFMFLFSQFFPQAQQLNVRPDGQPVALPYGSDVYEGIVEPLLLMTGRGLAVSIGPKMAEHSKKVLDAEEGVSSPAFVMRANLGAPVRELLASLDGLIDQAEAERDERELSQEDIEGARRATAFLAEAMPDGPSTAAFTTEFSNFGLLFAYRTQGPQLALDWASDIDEDVEEDFEALGRVLGEEEPSIEDETVAEPPAEAYVPEEQSATELEVRAAPTQ